MAVHRQGQEQEKDRQGDRPAGALGPGSPVDVDQLRAGVQDVYRQVAHDPHGDFHFERGRDLAVRLGYDPAVIEALPAHAVESFAGVGFPFGMTDVRPGETVLDLGSGSGMDALYAARLVGPEGRVIGVDMTDEQLEKARRTAARHDVTNVTFVRGFIEELDVADDAVDLVVSNGVINLAPDKPAVFREIARVLTPGGRMAISDIVTEKQLSDAIVCDASLWAACIGGAAQQDGYLAMIEAAGLTVADVREHPEYRFLSKSAQGASRDYGVKSVSVLAEAAP